MNVESENVQIFRLKRNPTMPLRAAKSIGNNKLPANSSSLSSQLPSSSISYRNSKTPSVDGGDANQNSSTYRNGCNVSGLSSTTRGNSAALAASAAWRHEVASKKQRQQNNDSSNVRKLLQPLSTNVSHDGTTTSATKEKPIPPASVTHLTGAGARVVDGETVLRHRQGAHEQEEGPVRNRHADPGNEVTAVGAPPLERGTPSPAAPSTPCPAAHQDEGTSGTTAVHSSTTMCSSGVLFSTSNQSYGCGESCPIPAVLPLTEDNRFAARGRETTKKTSSRRARSASLQKRLEMLAGSGPLW